MEAVVFSEDSLSRFTGLKIIARYLDLLAEKHVEGAVYRGHANANWQPIPFAFRPPRYGIVSRVEMQQWQQIAGRFVDRDMTATEWLVLAQHYGVPTPLLDWTANPLIALFFACLPFKATDDARFSKGAVLQIQREAFPTAPRNPSFDPLTDWSGPPMIVAADTMNSRSRAQDSVMTLHCKSNADPTSGYQFDIFHIEPDDKHTVISALKTFGISNDRIYADINTAATDFKDTLFQAKVQEAFGIKQPFVDANGKPIS